MLISDIKRNSNQGLVDLHQENKQKILNNNFKVINILNIIIVFCISFALFFNRWSHYEGKFCLTNKLKIKICQDYNVWVNLIYLQNLNNNNEVTSYSSLLNQCSESELKGNDKLHSGECFILQRVQISGIITFIGMLVGIILHIVYIILIFATILNSKKILKKRVNLFFIIK